MKNPMPAVRSAVPAVLAIPAFRALWFGQVASQLAMNMLLFLLGLLLYERTGSNAAVSGLFLAYGVPAVFFGMLAGVVVDRLDRRAVLMLCDITRALLMIPLYFTFQNVGLVYVFVFVNAIINQFYVPAEAPTIPQLVPPELLVTANSLFSFTYYTSMALGFVLAGPLLRIFGETGGFALIAVLFVLAAASVSRIPRLGAGLRSFARIGGYSVSYIFMRIKGDLTAGISYVSSVPALKDALLLLTATQIILAMLGTLGPGFADRIIGIDITHASTLIIGPVVLGIVAGALWVGSRGFRIAPGKLIRVGILSAGILLMALSVGARIARTQGLSAHPTAFGLAVFGVLFFLLGVANSFLDVPANSVLQKESQGSMRGRVYGVLAAAVGGVGMLPVVAGGFLADAIGVGKVILLLGAVVFGYGILRMRYNRS
jgi:MFS family permease